MRRLQAPPRVETMLTRSRDDRQAHAVSRSCSSFS
jgi:hypothetical protein